MLLIENALLLVIDLQVRLMPSIFNHEEISRSAATLIRGCRLLGIPVLVTQQYTKGLGETLPTMKDSLGEFEPIEKTTFSCYGNQEFLNKLEGSGRKRIIVTGVETHICVQQTAMHLLENGYNVYVAADCAGSRSENDRFYAEQRMRQAGVVLTTCESVLFEFLKSADHPKRKEISNLVK